jgi:DNA-binding transcriptional MerR regulator
MQKAAPKDQDWIQLIEIQASRTCKYALDPPLRGALRLMIREEEMTLLYTVKQLSKLAGVTVKTLHHYHRIGLLPPNVVTEAGYRMYGVKELERLQEILFFKELDFPLEAIRELLLPEPDRLLMLTEQKKLLLARIKRMERLMQTLDQTISLTAKGAGMDHKEMFMGFGSEDEWKEALSGQEAHLKETYGFDLLQDGKKIDVEKLNADAEEAARFMNGMAGCLREGERHDGSRVAGLIKKRLVHDKAQGRPASPADFAAQARFFLQDDFHRGMLESQQTGLAYYMWAAAEAYNAGSD